VSNEEIFFQELFKEGPISSIILQCPKSITKIMIKQKGKMLVKE
jgi:hypothetical protein